MAASRFGFPTPPPPGEDHTKCPICGWSPCTDACRLGLTEWEVSALEDKFDPVERPDFPCDGGHGGEGFFPGQEYLDEGDPE